MTLIDSFEAQKVISQYRGSAIVVATMTANMEWSQVTTYPDLDLMFSGAMGKASSIGLGLALARPDKKVIILDGDGSLLMNLGSLVTIANMAPPNLIHFLFENSVYRTSGGQTIPGVGNIRFRDFAAGAGYACIHDYETLATLEAQIADVMNQVGPTFVCLKTIPASERPPFKFTRTVDILSKFKTSLQRSSS